MCIATTEVNDEFYEEWKHTYYKASTSIQNRDKKLEEAAELIERVRYDARVEVLVVNYVSPLQGWETYCFSPGVRLSICLSQMVSAL